MLERFSVWNCSCASPASTCGWFPKSFERCWSDHPDSWVGCREGDLGAGQPRRMGECLASLDVGVWFNVISARTFASDREHSKMTAVWKHCRLVAQYAQLVAESLEGISADEAYLVGLLHEIGAIATVLEWPKDCPGGETRLHCWQWSGRCPSSFLLPCAA